MVGHITNYDDLRALTTHYVTSKYPDIANATPFEIYTRADAKNTIERAGRVIE
ncbi:MAG: HEPN domain-containing protein [Vulcanisaeta sp.]